MYSTRTWACVGLLALAGAMVVLLGYTGRDDSHLTYFVADHLAAGHGLVNLLGERQEQSSSLLFALLLGACVAITRVPAATLGPFVSAAMLSGAALVAGRTARRVGASPLVGPVACSTPALFYWSLSGMESSLYVLLLAWLVAVLVDAQGQARRGQLAMVACAALLATLTRPEAVIVLACLGAWLLLDRQPHARRRAVVTLIATGGAIALRRAAGLDVFPAPVYVKQQIAPTERLLAGLDYIVATARQLPASSTLLVCMVSLSLWAMRRTEVDAPRRRLAQLSLVLAGIVAGFAVLAGGDWMEAGRFFAPTFFFATLAALLLVSPRGFGALAAGVLLASTVDVAVVARQPYGGVPLFAAAPQPTVRYVPSAVERYNMVHTRDLPFVDTMLGVLAADKRPALHVGSIQGGIVPYYVSRALGDRVRFVELYGLTSRRTQACVSHWQWDPYGDLQALSNCLGMSIDYVFDLDDAAWSRVERLRAQGCEEVFRDERMLQGVSWKAPLAVRQFLMRCGPTEPRR